MHVYTHTTHMFGFFFWTAESHVGQFDLAVYLSQSGLKLILLPLPTENFNIKKGMNEQILDKPRK